MSMRKPAALIALAIAMAAFTQAPQPRNIPLLFTGTVRHVQPPEGPGAWLLQVISRGGVGGHGTGDFSISSTGGLILLGRGTTGEVPSEVLRLLGEYVRTSAPSQWTVDSRLGICSDCVATLMVLTVRDPAGLLQTYTVFWDRTTRGHVSSEVLRIHDLAAAVKGQ
jgi:hypothetical protein